MLIQYKGRYPSERTLSFLTSLESDKTLHKFLRLSMEYVVPITDYARIVVDQSISDFLNSKIKQYIIIFSVFIIYLASSLIFALNFVIGVLKKVVFRSRILIKIIPTEELKRINTIIKDKKEK